MLKNYFITAWRNLIKRKAFSFINIAGLSIGISVCFIIMLYVQDELNFDRFNKNADRIVRIVFKADINGGKIYEANVMPQVASAMTKDYPEVEDATRLRVAGAPKISYKGRNFRDDELVFVDPNFFSIFTLPLIEGDVKTALKEPNTLVITKAAAKKYFGNENPIGKTLVFTSNNNEPFKVTGLIDKVPVNSHFQFDLFGSMTGLNEAKSDSWMGSNFFTYILLKPGSDYKKLEAKLPGMVEKYMGPQIQQQMGVSLEQFRKKGNGLGFVLQPLTSIHLYSHSNYELTSPGNVMYVYIFSAIAIFMLLIACINFINLSTASASKRAKEVGVRKVIGSGRLQLVKQFLLESALLTFFALLISYGLIQFLLPVFNDISGKDLSFEFEIRIIAAFIGLGVFVSIVAGMYPAFFLSSFKPASVLKGKFTGGNNSFGLRSSLVVFQFFISVALIVGTIVVWQQMKYIQHKNLGYNKEQLLTISNSWALGKNERIYKEKMLKDPRIVNATISAYKPAGPSGNNNALAYPSGRDNEMMRTLEYQVDEQYIPTLGMQLAAGRNFSRDLATDSTAMIVNETAAKAFGWGVNDAIGKTIVRKIDKEGKGMDIPFHIVGVVKDFNFKSLHEPITPLLMVLGQDWGLIFKIKTTDIPGLLSAMKKEWANFQTDEPFTYAFMDNLYNKTYVAEQKTSAILNIFSALTIFVSCLGLFGLITYTAEQRTKEIGIRKVLGADVSQITGMLSKDFIKLVCIAILIAFPISYWAMNKWLQNFAYRINTSWWMFVASGVIALLIALITVSFQAIKAATANPVNSLRME
ncbi:putative ABC transport system permease protein [Hydrobacter penzbergensis]|uniref:Putative ABC transport system permease protein n=1 Tax=Hydrobacter penzbergensis TaxID=1235997 RepID=A0A8X8I957_9BACT|nr:putative ABC transport system permease protein [Hydrobacter penzbergensis]